MYTYLSNSTYPLRGKDVLFYFRENLLFTFIILNKKIIGTPPWQKRCQLGKENPKKALLAVFFLNSMKPDFSNPDLLRGFGTMHLAPTLWYVCLQIFVKSNTF